MARDGSAEILARLRLFESLPEQALGRLAASAISRAFTAGETLFREGAQNDQWMIVTNGRVALEMQVPGRGGVRILSLGPGDMLAWSALLGGGRMTTSAVALQETRVASIPAAAVTALCQSEPNFGYELMRHVATALANRLVATRLQLLDLFSDTPPVIPQRTV